MFPETRNITLTQRCTQNVTQVHIRKGGAVDQSVERVTPDEEVPGSIPAVAARSLPVESLSV